VVEVAEISEETRLAAKAPQSWETVALGVAPAMLQPTRVHSSRKDLCSMPQATIPRTSRAATSVLLARSAVRSLLTSHSATWRLVDQGGSAHRASYDAAGIIGVSISSMLLSDEHGSLRSACSLSRNDETLLLIYKSPNPRTQCTHTPRSNNPLPDKSSHALRFRCL
jgi:hypothetical protein